MLASDLNAELHIAHVIESNWDGALEIAQSELKQLTGEDGVFRTAIAIANPVVPSLTTLEGNAPDMITDQIADLHPRLVIMGIGRDFTMNKIFKGSTVDKIVANSVESVPVVKTRPVSLYKNALYHLTGLLNRARLWRLLSGRRLMPISQSSTRQRPT